MTMTTFTLFTDGGSRGNPGPAGIGFILMEGSQRSCYGGAPIGKATNNIAEYKAMIWGLRNALQLGARDLDAFSDSELLVKQLCGEYKVKNAALRPLFVEAMKLSQQFERCDFAHIPREENTEADEMANKAMDAGLEVGSPCVPFETPSSLFDFTDSFPAVVALKQDHEKQPEPALQLKTSVNEVPPYVPLPQTQKQRQLDSMINTENNNSATAPSTGIYALTVKDHFDAAHSLYGYPGECANLHGHTWDVEVTVESLQLCELGMVYDFALLKKDLKSVLATWDHKHINEIAPFDDISPTAENLARIIFEDLSKFISQPGVTLKEVAVWESPIAKLTYRLH